MGSWGTGLYQSDAGLDARDTYRDVKRFGFRGADLAAVVLDTLGIGAAPNGEDETIAQLVLADLLWKDGMLPKDMRQTALRLIKESALHLQWEDAKSQRKQQEVLDKLAEKLASPQPAKPAKIKPPYIEQCDFELGEILAYPYPQGAWTLLRVIAYFTRFRGRSPICEVLDWEGRVIPSLAAIKEIPFKKQVNVPILGAARPEETVASLIEMKRLPPGAKWQDYEDQMIAPHIPLIRMSERDPHFHKINRLRLNVPSQRPFLNHWFVARNAWIPWKDLPAKLESYFAPEPEWPEDDTELT
jgi:hypothetical protein